MKIKHNKEKNLREIAYANKEVIESFHKTPIYNLLLERSAVARELLKMNPDVRDEQILEMYNKEIKRFFVINK